MYITSLLVRAYVFIYISSFVLCLLIYFISRNAVLILLILITAVYTYYLQGSSKRLAARKATHNRIVQSNKLYHHHSERCTSFILSLAVEHCHVKQRWSYIKPNGQ